MYQHHISHRLFPGGLRDHTLKAGNSLGIVNPSFIWDRERHQLILIMETKQRVSKEINAIVKDNNLILEAPLISSYNKPFRTHLIGQEIRDEFEEGLMVIGFSELKLKHGYHYHLISCQAVDSKLIKVILGFKVWGRNGHN